MIIFRNCVHSPGLCPGSGDAHIPGLCFVIMDFARLQDSGNLEWRLVILDYDCSTGFRSCYRIPGNRNGICNTKVAQK